MEFQEKFLHHIWDQRHLLDELKTISGKSLKISYQGQYNTFNGPDFKNAVLILDGETLQGDVEIHLRTYDWIAHQHQEDRAYNSTILHVVYEHKAAAALTIREDATGIEILELKDQTAPEIAKLFIQYQSSDELKNRQACDYFTLGTDEQLLPLLKAEGWERFLRKVNRFNAELHFHSFDQLLYNGFMEALGYGKNKFNTLSVAQQFRWDTLQEWQRSGLDSLSLAAIWLHYSDLMEQAGKILDPEFLKIIKNAYEEQSFTAAKGQVQWNLFRIRPANHPVWRFLQAAYVIDKLLNKGFLKTILDAFRASEAIRPGSFIANLQSQFEVQNAYKEQIGAVGKALLQTITGNVFMPVIYLYAEKINDTNLKDMVRTAYTYLPAENKNYITGFMSSYLNQPQAKLFNTKFMYQQGLMNVFFRFCNYRLCDLCLKEKQKKLLAM